MPYKRKGFQTYDLVIKGPWSNNLDTGLPIQGPLVHIQGGAKG